MGRKFLVPLLFTWAGSMHVWTVDSNYPQGPSIYWSCSLTSTLWNSWLPCSPTMPESWSSSLETLLSVLHRCISFSSLQPKKKCTKLQHKLYWNHIKDGFSNGTQQSPWQRRSSLKSLVGTLSWSTHQPFLNTLGEFAGDLKFRGLHHK